MPAASPAMATSPCSSSGVSSSSSSGLGADAGLEIRTRSVEQTLVPLVSQVEIPRASLTHPPTPTLPPPAPRHPQGLPSPSRAAGSRPGPASPFPPEMEFGRRRTFRARVAALRSPLSQSLSQPRPLPRIPGPGSPPAGAPRCGGGIPLPERGRGGDAARTSLPEGKTPKFPARSRCGCVTPVGRRRLRCRRRFEPRDAAVGGGGNHSPLRGVVVVGGGALHRRPNSAG